MKKTTILFTALSSLFFQGCIKSEGEVTTEVRCLINGQKYYRYKYTRGIREQGLQASMGGYYFQLWTELKRKADDEDQFVYIFDIFTDTIIPNTKLELRFGRRYISNIDANGISGGRPLPDTLIFSRLYHNEQAFAADSSTAWISFDIYDTENRRIKGQFGGTYYNDSGDVLQITDGRFDIKAH